MWPGIVHGEIISTAKHESLRNAKLLIVQPINPVTQQPDGLAQIAIDTLGAGNGQKVLLSGDGLGTQKMLNAGKDCPVRLAVVALLREQDIHIKNGGK